MTQIAASGHLTKICVYDIVTPLWCLVLGAPVGRIQRRGSLTQIIDESPDTREIRPILQGALELAHQLLEAGLFMHR